MSGLALTPATVADANAILALRDDRAQWMVEQGIDQWRPGEASRDWLLGWIDDGVVHVVRGDGRLDAVVAVLWEDPDVWPDDAVAAGYVHMLTVGRHRRGERLGSEVLGWAEAHIRRQGRAVARLDHVVDNRWLADWYAAHGYRCVGTPVHPFPDQGQVVAPRPCVLREKLLA